MHVVQASSGVIIPVQMHRSEFEVLVLLLNVLIEWSCCCIQSKVEDHYY